MTRSKKAIKNIKAGILGKIIALILAFISRTVFIYYIGVEYLGVNSLYTEILSIISVVELGFGSAMTFAMYKPIAQNDTLKVAQLLDYYKTIYRYIALAVFIVGASLIPFLDNIVNNTTNISLLELKFFYSIFLFNSVIGYLVVYKYSIVNAYQKNYIITNIDVMINTIIVCIQIILLFVFKNFTIYLLAKSILLLISRIIITFYLNENFSIFKVKPNTKLSKEDKDAIIINVKAMAIHQFSSVAVYATDNIIISMCTGLGIVGVAMLSNYTLLMQSVLSFVLIIFSSITSAFGNIVAESTPNHFHKKFLQYNFINFWIYGFCSIAFYVLIPPFITLWIGGHNLIDNNAFLLIIINCYMEGQSTAYHFARIAKGEFNRDKWLGFLQAIINLVISIVCAKVFGLIGVFIGTIVSRIFYIALRPQSTYRFLFNVSSIEYYKLFAIYSTITFMAGIVTYFATYKVLENITIMNFLLSCVLVLLVPNIFFICCFYKNKKFQETLVTLKGLVKYHT